MSISNQVQIQHNPSAKIQLDLGLSQIHSQVELAFVFDMTLLPKQPEKLELKPLVKPAKEN